MTIEVRGADDQPVARDDAATVEEDAFVVVDVLANDSDADGDSLTVSELGAPAHGSVEIRSVGVRYTPDPNFHGTDRFTYTVSDGKGGTATAEVTIEVRSANDRPVAADDSVTTAEGETLSEAAPGVLANDSDADGDSLTASLVDGPSHGTLSVEADGSFTYEPDAGYHGADAFTYVARDAEQASAAATVAITVTSVNDSPVARDDAATVEEDGSVVVDVLANDSDADGDELTVSELGAPAHGSAEVTSTGVRYMPATDFHGTDRFTYTVTDGNGKSATAEVVIEVRPVNDRPVAGDDSITVVEGQTLSAVPPGVLTNDSDADGDALTASLLDGPGHGTLSLEADGSFTYQPAAGYHGSDAFTYVARDGDVRAPRRRLRSRSPRSTSRLSRGTMR